MALTLREEKFCIEYVNKLDKAKAAVAAGYSKKTARQIGYEVFTKPDIQKRIAEIRQDLKEQLGIDEHSIITELHALGFWNIKDFVAAGNVIKDISKLPKSKLTPVVGIKVKETFTPTGDKEVTTELKLSDKRAAIVDLGRHLGIFEADNKQSALKIKVTRK